MDSMATRTPAPAAKLLGDQPTVARLHAASAAGGVQSGTAVRRGRECPACLERYPMDFRVCPRDATELRDVSEDDEPDTLIGQRVGDTFSIVRTIGEGGMARVYEARHVRLPNKRFALKVLHHMYAQQQLIVARFQREAEAVSGIGHPNVIDVYDVGTTPDGRPYLVSEYLDGKDFASLLDERGRLEAPAAVHVVRQVCRALTAAHARGVVHRDVKPENVFLIGNMDAPVVKVIDFGISKVDGPGGASLTQTGMIMGTPGYMPPEQARGAKTDHRVDIYGVGAMLYRALTGQLPFDSDDAAEALSMVLTQDAPRPRSIEASIPEALELVIQRAMAKDPEDRYASMAELDERLAPFDPETQASVSLLPPSPNMRGVTPRPPLASLSGARRPSSNHLARDTRDAKMARPTLILSTVVAYLWIIGCLIDAGTFGLAVLRGMHPPTLTERLIVAITVSAISLTPLIFWLRHIGRVWGNSVRAIQQARVLRRVVLAATVPYAFLMLAVRVLPPPVDPRWAPALSTVSVVIAFLAYATGRVGASR
jgi:serine/threonine-protein kinase